MQKNQAFKRPIDLLVALVLTVILLPVILLVALLVWIDVKYPVLFIQDRTGLHGRIFKFYKFRTMRAGTASDEARLTPIGRFLRQLSLDELPQLLNIIRGDMSLVGPRPLLPEYLGRYSPRQNRRHEVKPGLTGWAQVNGRNAISWDDKFELDVWYVDHQSFWLDVKILLMTIPRVLVSVGVSTPGMATTTPFLGSKKKEDFR